MFRLSAKEIPYVALGIALISICSWISIPAGIPFTLQTFAVCLVTALLGLKCGLWAVAGFILLGAMGVPVFSGFRGGPGVLLGTTGGYLIGFLFTALTIGLILRRFGESFPVLLCAMVAGLLLCYAFGTVWFMVVYARSASPISLAAALNWCVFPYLIPDILKILLACELTRRLRPPVHIPGKAGSRSHSA